jgi:D-glycero-beta-D-manno-heptose 1-phosphate adenylyltransferase
MLKKTNHIVISRETARRLSRSLQVQGQKLVFTNGCFDILHIGHVKYLEKAKSLGDVLMVGINSDRSAKILKGPRRPLITEEERAKIISSLYSVDYAIIFDEETPIQLISELKPNIHVKGGDYTMQNLPEYNIVYSYGGKIKILSYINGKSTTNIIKQIISTYDIKNGTR